MEFDLDYLLRQLPALRAGLLLTIEASGIAILLSLVLGLLGASIRVLRVPLLAPLVAGYVEFIRNTPLLVQLFFVFFGLPVIGLTLSLFWSGVLALVLWAG
ncbi:MAG: amino acid ABC transporter permease, partial [Acetobacteraceae bacterium]